MAPDFLRVAADGFEANHAEDVVSTSPAFPGVDTAAHSFTTGERALFICESDKAQRARCLPGSKMARQFEKCGNGGAIVVRAGRVLVRVVMGTNDHDRVFVLLPCKLRADINESFALGVVMVQRRRIACLPEYRLDMDRGLLQGFVMVNISCADLGGETIDIPS